jgi:hypothetical protein
LPGAALFSYHLADMFELIGYPLVCGNDIVEGVSNPASNSFMAAEYPNGEIALPHGMERIEKIVELAGRLAIFAGPAGRAHRDF